MLSSVLGPAILFGIGVLLLIVAALYREIDIFCKAAALFLLYNSGEKEGEFDKKRYSH